MIGLRNRPRYHRPELPLVPLIDVLVMLVFFAFATMQFREKAVPTMNLTLPEVESAGKSVLKRAVIIAIDKDQNMRVTIQGGDGKMVLDQINVSLPQLDKMLAELSSADKNIVVLIRSDKRAPVEAFVSVVDHCNKYGLKNRKLHTR